ncbi:hypothetical protein SEA_DAMASCUS_77 [Microbacterium phage Damascus]|nr:hypothetical protein SEA_DAMASCUS_77 [Microbacterium phage Damascus]
MADEAIWVKSGGKWHEFRRVKDKDYSENPLKGNTMSKKIKRPLVQAMQIRTEDAYSYYLDLPAKVHHEFEAICGDYLLLYPGEEVFWAWMEKDDFEKIYAPVELPSNVNFTYFTRKN